MVTINFIDGFEHDLTKEYALLSKDPFSVSVALDSEESVDTLINEVKSICEKIDGIESLSHKSMILTNFLDELGKQLGASFNTLEDFLQWAGDQKSVFSFSKKEIEEGNPKAFMSKLNKIVYPDKEDDEPDDSAHDSLLEEGHSDG